MQQSSSPGQTTKIIPTVSIPALNQSSSGTLLSKQVSSSNLTNTASGSQMPTTVIITTSNQGSNQLQIQQNPGQTQSGVMSKQNTGPIVIRQSQPSNKPTTIATALGLNNLNNSASNNQSSSVESLIKCQQINKQSHGNKPQTVQSLTQQQQQHQQQIGQSVQIVTALNNPSNSSSQSLTQSMMSLTNNSSNTNNNANNTAPSTPASSNSAPVASTSFATVIKPINSVTLSIPSQQNKQGNFFNFLFRLPPYFKMKEKHPRFEKRNKSKIFCLF